MKQRLRDLEARDNWLAARIDELLDDVNFAETWEFRGYTSMLECAKRTAESEHAAIMADIDDERISLVQGGQYE